MPVRRDHRRFGARCMLLNALSMLPFIPVFMVIWHRCSHDRFDTVFWAALSTFIIGAVFGLWWQARRASHMKCPQCSQWLRRTSHPKPGDPINFICISCDVEWVTGLVESRGD